MGSEGGKITGGGSNTILLTTGAGSGAAGA
jgi:hypothetical protein